MFEKVNPCHPDKIADRIAGAIVDLAYGRTKLGHPKIAVEVLVGHGACHIIAETSERLDKTDIEDIVHRIAGDCRVDYKEYKQDKHLADNQQDGIRCGDNGIFKGVVPSEEEIELSKIARTIYWKYKADGKYILDNKTNRLVICQSNAKTDEIKELFPKAKVNPIGEWTGGTSVDTGATNRKLGSDMGRAATGGGLHGKDLTKADVSINVYLHKLVLDSGVNCECSCAIGDGRVWIYTSEGDVIAKRYDEIVEEARKYIKALGGFEKFAEWGLI